jgi:hypothetical protein
MKNIKFEGTQQFAINFHLVFVKKVIRKILLVSSINPFQMIKREICITVG